MTDAHAAVRARRERLRRRARRCSGCATACSCSRTRRDVEALARAVRPGRSRCCFVPGFVGLGRRTGCPEARGVIFGLTRDTSSADLGRAALRRGGASRSPTWSTPPTPTRARRCRRCASTAAWRATPGSCNARPTCSAGPCCRRWSTRRPPWAPHSWRACKSASGPISRRLQKLDANQPPLRAADGRGNARTAAGPVAPGGAGGYCVLPRCTLNIHARFCSKRQFLDGSL